MLINKDYSVDYYDEQQHGSKQSAQAIIPLVLNLVQPKSVVDVGCGVGTWLSVFKANGITDIVGIDGEYIDSTMLHIPKENFLSANLEQPITLQRKFDLVVSVEVAEHLSVAVAEQFIQSLTQLGDCILFSAAIPFQGGPHHVNEQWPEYWQKYFQKFNYVPVDALRRKIWNNTTIEVWYRQNILLYVKKDILEKNALLQNELQYTHLTQLSLVHPEIYLRDKQ